MSAVERYPEWLATSGVTSVERAEGGPISEGSRFEIEQRIARRSTQAEARVTAFARDERFAFEASDTVAAHLGFNPWPIRRLVDDALVPSPER